MRTSTPRHIVWGLLLLAFIFGGPAALNAITPANVMAALNIPPRPMAIN